MSQALTLPGMTVAAGTQPARRAPGRPAMPKHEKRTKTVRVSLNEQEYAVLQAAAAETGQAIAVVTRDAALGRLPKAV